MTRERPPVVLVLSILNMVFGGLHLLCVCLASLGLAVIFTASNKSMNPVANIMTEINKELPGYLVLATGEVVVQMILAIVLIVAGIGLLKMQNWARLACVFYGVSIILVRAFDVVYSIGFVQPATQRVVRRMGVGGNPSENIGTMIGTIVGAGVLITYAIVLVVLLYLPSVSAAFAGKTTRRLDDDYNPFSE